jgi:hypothetical protein
MPKKVSTMPVTKPAKKTPVIAKAETDQSWSKLTSHTPTVSKKTPKKQTKSGTRGAQSQRQEKTTPTIDSKLVFTEDVTKFPHTGFPIRLEYKDNNDKKTCWFQCYNHFEKHITRYKITQYEATTNDVALVGEVTGTKSKRV